jgi:hypothetical protein
VMYLDGHVAGQPVRRPPHPFSKRGYGPVANLSDDALRTTRVRKGQTDLDLDVIYGLP